MRRASIGVSLLAVMALAVAGCGNSKDDSAGGSGSTETSGGGTGVCATNTSTGDLLAEICDRGKVVVSTDPKYPPQSSYNESTGEFEGFDIDVATEIANRLGVDIGWEEPDWTVITAGKWAGRWDMSVGSMTPTNDRQKVLDFSQPYYYTPAVVVVNKANTSVQDLSTDLDGADIGVCSACTYESFLEKTLAIKGFTFNFIIDDANVHGYKTDTLALDDLALGDGARLDAVITSLTTAQGYIDAGKPVKIVGDPVFYEPLAVAIDKSAPADPTSFAAAVDQIVGEMHDDGTLTELSKKWYDGVDLTVQQ
ncbi:MAG TPA: transporter substrate-binding domain-containing protein [Nocardioidaceae bacterium]|nr:transporter substrate-binding domain-containing protein [Nocardioidaceae bacterium]